MRYADEKNVLSECAVFDARVRGRGKRTSEIRPIVGAGTFSTASLGLIETAMAPFTGFGALKTPRDLLRKMEHDHARMESEPSNEYAAFDFFVTAEHMLDWIHPGRNNKKVRESVRDSEVLLQVTSHIANGAKHFEATDSCHKSVIEIERDRKSVV